MSRADAVALALQPDGLQKTVAPAATTFPPVTSEGIEPDVAVLEHNATEGDRFPRRQKRGGRAYGGDIEGGLRPDSMGLLLTMAFGEPVTTQPDVTNAATVYRHTWNPKAAGKRPMPATVWTINNDVYQDTGVIGDVIVDQYIGAMMNEFAWTIEANDYLLYTASLFAIRNVPDVVAPAVTMDDTELWSFEEIGAEISVPSIAAGAYQDFPIYDWNMSYGNGLTGNDRFRIGSTEIVRLRPGNVEATVGFTAAEELEAHYRRAIAQEPELVKIRLNALGRLFYDAPLAANDLYESLSVEIKAAEYTSGNIPISADDTLEDLEVEANMVKDDAGDFLSVILTNEDDGTSYVAP
jgi:hypothetical protein